MGLQLPLFRLQRLASGVLLLGDRVPARRFRDDEFLRQPEPDELVHVFGGVFEVFDG